MRWLIRAATSRSSRRTSDLNPAFKNPQETPGVEVIIWKKDQLWRILELDEAGIDLGIKTAETPHTSTDKQVRRKGFSLVQR